MLSDREFQQLLSYLDRPWAGFRKVRKGVKKRVRRHMEVLECTTIDQYISKVEQDLKARVQCEQCLTVTISRFFRDRWMWEHLKKNVLHDLIDRFSEGLAVWSAGCAGGEEPYTLAMIWEELVPTFLGRPSLQILATDSDELCLQRARRGIFEKSSLKEVPENHICFWFKKIRGGRQYQIRASLKKNIRWQVHQLFDKPPQGPFHIILLRNNLLTYYQGEGMETAFKQILETLKAGGVLIAGSHERLPSAKLPLKRDPVCPWIYRVIEESSYS
jgi:chemotaxis protein methyltransferase CheR